MFLANTDFPLNDDDPLPAGAPARSRRMALGCLLGFGAAGLGALLLTLCLMHWGSRETTPVLTEADFEAACRRWDVQGPANYDLDLDLFGKRAGHVHVAVREGKAVRLIRDGVEPKQQRTWEYWTVPGQFDTIGQELEKAADPVAGFQAPAGARVLQRAQFDAHFGYPAVYHRQILGTDLEIGWRITRFDPLTPEQAAAEQPLPAGEPQK